MKYLLKTLPLAFGLSASLGHAASGSWNVNADGNWSDIANWNGTIIADAADSTATFTNDLTADRIVTLDSNRTIGNITFGDAAVATAGSWTISGPNILTLDRTTGTPTITTNALGSGKTATISSVITGNDGLTITSAGANGTLVLSGANTYSGVTTINTLANGALGVIANNASAFGTSSILINGSNQFNVGISVGAGLNMSNALTLKSINLGSARALVGLGSGSTWSGNITVDSSTAPTGGFAGFIAGGANTATASTISGNFSYIAGTNTNALAFRGSGVFGQVTGAVSLASAKVQLLDTTNWQFSNTSNSWGELEIANTGATAFVGAANALAANGVVSSATVAGGTLRLNDMAGANAYSQAIAGLNGTVRVALSTGAATLTLNTTANQASSGVISNAITLTKTGNATQTLTGVNTYTGGTNVNGGTLQAGNASALGTGAVNIGGGALSTTVTNLGTGALALTSGSLTLNGSAAGTATLGVNTDFTMSGGQWAIDLANGTDQILGNGVGADFLISGGTLDLGGGAINYGSTYNLLTGFATGSVSSLTISNYNTASYIASLGNNGVLSFSVVPEPSVALVSSLGLLGLLRRRRH